MFCRRRHSGLVQHHGLRPHNLYAPNTSTMLTETIFRARNAFLTSQCSLCDGGVSTRWTCKCEAATAGLLSEIPTSSIRRSFCNRYSAHHFIDTTYIPPARERNMKSSDFARNFAHKSARTQIRHYSAFGANGSTFQMLSAYSSIHLSLLKKPILATLVMHLVIHSSWLR